MDHLVLNVCVQDRVASPTQVGARFCKPFHLFFGKHASHETTIKVQNYPGVSGNGGKVGDPFPDNAVLTRVDVLVRTRETWVGNSQADSRFASGFRDEG